MSETITTISELILKSLYLFIPAAVANIMPVLVKKINFLNYPIDFGKEYKGKRIFGDHKTFRGFFFGILGAMLVVLLQKYLTRYPNFAELTLIDFSKVNAFLCGFLLGFGVLAGDAIKSFFKRRANIAPGKPWIPFDQLDLLFGALIFTSFVYLPPLKVIIFAFIAGPLLHIGFNLLGYYLGIKKNKL
ncbi:CDP-2,3-bis-(O-geranylgeranyl)-sn-glycerol synthase [Candidatus Woesearchaeota archaeon]|nr:CDP-2,3-bis-(O-geranylgeranyl)-sn-glycerol synthase [Candidatus Woesearchaeota archaeon]